MEKFITDNRIEDLMRLHTLMKRVNNQMNFKNAWVSILKAKGQLMIKDEIFIKKSFKCVEDLIHFRKKADSLISRVFSDKETLDIFKGGVKEALEHFLNIHSNVMAEYLAKFLDFHLKKSSG